LNFQEPAQSAKLASACMYLEEFFLLWGYRNLDLQASLLFDNVAVQAKMLAIF
jgi:hypothetical protein